MDSEAATDRPFVSKAIPFLRTRIGKVYLLIGVTCTLIIILGIGFLLYTVRILILFKCITSIVIYFG